MNMDISKVETEMQKKEILEFEELRAILGDMVDSRVEATITYLGNNCWQNVKANFIDMSYCEIRLSPASMKDFAPATMHVALTVGVAAKHQFCKYLFETTVHEIGMDVKEGLIILDMPKKIEQLQRRSTRRITIPEEVNIDVKFWQKVEHGAVAHVPTREAYTARLVDISTAGFAIAFPKGEEIELTPGQRIGLRLTLRKGAEAMTYDAQLTNMHDTADAQNVCLGLKLILPENETIAARLQGQLSDAVEFYRNYKGSAMHLVGA